MTLDPNMFLPTASSGKAQLIPDPGNTFISQVANILGSAVAASAAGPTTINATGLVSFKFAFPTGTATATFSVTSPDAIEIVDVIVNKVGAGAGNTVQVQTSGGTAISDAIAAATDKAVTRAGTIDTAQNAVAAGGSFKVVNTFAAGTVQANVTVVCRRT